MTEREFLEKYKDSAFVPFGDLERFMNDTLTGIGVPAPDAAIIADVLIESDKRGIDSHGIGRLKPIYIDRIDKGILNPVTEIEIVKDEKAAAVIDGHDGMGHVIAFRAMDMAIRKAEEYGMGMVAVRNSSHYGIAGYYATMATERGMIGITGTNARPSIAPTFGVENMLGTNPLTIGIPTDDPFPFVIDAATSVSQRGKIEVYGRVGKDIPPGWVIDDEGNTRTDTEGILRDLTLGKAALTPLGGIGTDGAGYKGYGYATVVEILSAALQDNPYLKALTGKDEEGKDRPYHLGHFFIAVNPDFFLGKALFRKIASSILNDLRNSRKAPGEDRIYTAGELEWEARGYRMKYGCPVPPPLQRVIDGLSERFGLHGKWPWTTPQEGRTPSWTAP